MDTEAASLAKSVEPVCSVCIANYNGRKVIEACLDSVFRQNYSYPIEVIVHDDASTDGSADIVIDKFPSVRLIKSDRNVGFCISNNRMAARAKGKYILFLNNDACLFPDALSKLYNYAESKNEAMILGLPQYDMETGELIDRGSLFDPFLNPVPNKDIRITDVGMVMGACLWLPKGLWEELGGFLEWFQTLAEDMYLCCLARLMGYPVRVLPDSGFKHWVGKSLGGGKVDAGRLVTSIKRRALSERNKSYVMLLCYPVPLAYILIPLHLLLLTIEGLALSVVKRNLRIWNDIYRSCFSALWNKRHDIVQLRRKIQTSRLISSRSFYSVHSVMPHKLTMLLKYGLPTVK